MSLLPFGDLAPYKPRVFVPSDLNQRLNSEGHPHPQVVQRYKDLGTTVWNTADQGGYNIYLGPQC